MLVLLLAAGTTCSVDDCSSVCERQRGFWESMAGCAAPELAGVRWEIALGVTGAECDVTVTACDGAKPRSFRATRDCSSQAASVEIAGSVCAVTIDAMGVSAVCRANGKTCEIAFAKSSSPLLSCATPDAGAPDGRADASGDVSTD